MLHPNHSCSSFFISPCSSPTPVQNGRGRAHGPERNCQQKPLESRGSSPSPTLFLSFFFFPPSYTKAIPSNSGKKSGNTVVPFSGVAGELWGQVAVRAMLTAPPENSGAGAHRLFNLPLPLHLPNCTDHTCFQWSKLINCLQCF